MKYGSSLKLRAATTAVFAACLMSSLGAHAAPSEFVKVGYDDFKSSFSYYGPSDLFSATVSAKSNPGFFHNGYPNGSAKHGVDSHFQVGVSLFNKQGYIVSTFATAERSTKPAQSPSIYVHGRVFVANDLLYYAIDRDADGNGAASAVFQRGLSRTFFDQSYSTTVGPIPVTVRGSVQGSATGGTGADVRTGWLSADATNYLFGQAGISGRFSLTVGVRDVLAAGVEGWCNFLTANFSPTAFANAAIENVAGKAVVAYRWGHRGPLTLSTLDGWLNMFVDVPFYTYDKNLLNWRGVSWTRDLWNSSKYEQYGLNW